MKPIQSSKRWATCAIALACMVLFLFCLPSDSFARAGGGNLFSGGGGGGGSFGGGGGGGGDGAGFLLYILLELVVHRPLLGIPLCMVVGVVFYLNWRYGHSAYQSHTIRRGMAASARTVPMHVSSGIASIQARDADFSPEQLQERLADVFVKVQQGWSRQEIGSVCTFLSDGLSERFSLQTRMQKEMGLRNVMEDVRVLDARVIGVQCGAAYDVVDVRITATAVDYTVDATTGKVVYGHKGSETFGEVWSCLRRPGARTLSRPGLLEGHCPNCGHVLELGQVGTCPSCESLVRSGEYDWVVSEITQLDGWQGYLPQETPGLAALQSLDPDFSRQDVEDRASAIFWRLRAAEFFADASYLNQIAEPAVVSKWADRVKPNAEGRCRIYASPAVGAVDVVSVNVNDKDGMDHVFVRVIWSGRATVVDPGAQLLPTDTHNLPMSHCYELVRKSGVRSDRRQGLSSTHCHGCGAPQQSVGDLHCQYCGMQLGDSGACWVLRSVQPFLLYEGKLPGQAGQVRESGAGARGFVPLLTRTDNEKLLRCVIGVMLADGEIVEKEREMLKVMAGRRGVSLERLTELEQMVRHDASVQAPAAGDYDENSEFLRSLVVMCLADGKVTQQERALIKSLVAHMGYADVDIDGAIKREKQILYQAARAELKAARKMN